MGIMDEPRNFHKDLAIGRRAERWFLEKFGGKDGCNDVMTHIEIKNSFRHDSIFLEDKSDVERNVLGWVWKLKTDNVVFVDTENNKAIIIKKEELVIRYRQVRSNYRMIEQISKRGNRTWKSQGHWIKIKDFDHLVMEFVGKDDGLKFAKEESNG